ncbi:MAG: HAMP domain-containing sensor histidine kinase [Bacteroidales bacterium]
MATDLKYKIALHRGFFIYILIFVIFFILGLLIFLYSKESNSSEKEMDSLLQVVNTQVYNAHKYKESIDSLLTNDKSLHSINSLRVTLIDTLGNVLYDSDVDESSMENHSNRPEFINAMRDHHAYIVKRKSKTTSKPYFYSALRKDDLIIRSAVEYKVSFVGLLRQDKNLLWFVTLFAILICLITYQMTRSLRQNILKLELFAEKTSKGETIDTDNLNFPNDELGNISNQMISLYQKSEKAQKALILEHQRADMLEQEQIRRKKQLSLNINHELKTPVSSIQGYLETIINHEDMPADKAMLFVEKSYQQCLRLSQLLLDLSTITRMDEGENMIEKEEVCLSEILDISLNDLHSIIEDKGFEVMNNLPSNLIIKANQTLISSIFNNLINNALAYSGGNEIDISLLKEDNTQYTISFSDNGVGIPEEHQNRVFERFYRIDKGRSRQYGGTGLGLSIVRNSVMIHGGNILVRNKALGGAEFIFTLNKA